MHPSMFNNLPDAADAVKGCAVMGFVSLLLGVFLGYLLWGKQW